MYVSSFLNGLGVGANEATQEDTFTYMELRKLGIQRPGESFLQDNPMRAARMRLQWEISMLAAAVGKEVIRYGAVNALLSRGEVVYRQLTMDILEANDL